MSARRALRVTTHADGFGRWHATVSPADGRGWGNVWPDEPRMDSIRAAARRAIRREILERMPRGTTAAQLRPVRIVVTANDLDHMNVLRSLTFGEREDN